MFQWTWTLVLSLIALLGSGVYFGTTTELPSAEILLAWAQAGLRGASVVVLVGGAVYVVSRFREARERPRPSLWPPVVASALMWLAGFGVGVVVQVVT